MDDDVKKAEIVGNISSVLPAMNVNLPTEQENKVIISDEQLLRLYDEVLNDLREDRIETDNLLSQFTELVINDGDSSSSSKEALTNLMKIKTDISDKKSKIALMMTQLKSKEKDVLFPRYLAANQTNNVTINKKLSKNDKRALIEENAKDE